MSPSTRVSWPPEPLWQLRCCRPAYAGPGSLGMFAVWPRMALRQMVLSRLHAQLPSALPSAQLPTCRAEPVGGALQNPQAFSTACLASARLPQGLRHSMSQRLLNQVEPCCPPPAHAPTHLPARRRLLGLLWAADLAAHLLQGLLPRRDCRAGGLHALALCGAGRHWRRVGRGGRWARGFSGWCLAGVGGHWSMAMHGRVLR